LRHWPKEAFSFLSPILIEHEKRLFNERIGGAI
jgi:hypothetical protein